MKSANDMKPNAGGQLAALNTGGRDHLLTVVWPVASVCAPPVICDGRDAQSSSANQPFEQQELLLTLLDVAV
jgi:hypothetical protein